MTKLEWVCFTILGVLVAYCLIILVISLSVVINILLN